VRFLTAGTAALGRASHTLVLDITNMLNELEHVPSYQVFGEVKGIQGLLVQVAGAWKRRLGA